jgi:hypothetical protein
MDQVVVLNLKNEKFKAKKFTVLTINLSGYFGYTAAISGISGYFGYKRLFRV